MQLIIDRHRLRIVPETPQDEAFLEEVLGLKKAGDHAMATRVGALHVPEVWFCLEIMPVVKITTSAAGLWEPTSDQTQEPRKDPPPLKAEPESPTSNPPIPGELVYSFAKPSRRAYRGKS